MLCFGKFGFWVARVASKPETAALVYLLKNYVSNSLVMSLTFITATFERGKVLQKEPVEYQKFDV